MYELGGSEVLPSFAEYRAVRSFRSLRSFCSLRIEFEREKRDKIEGILQQVKGESKERVGWATRLVIRQEKSTFSKWSWSEKRVLKCGGWVTKEGVPFGS